MNAYRTKYSSFDNDGSVVVLVLLDLSASFDMIDHAFILSRLRDMYRIHDQAFVWIRSYLSDRVHWVSAALREYYWTSRSSILVFHMVLFSDQAILSLCQYHPPFWAIAPFICWWHTTTGATSQNFRGGGENETAHFLIF